MEICNTVFESKEKFYYKISDEYYIFIEKKYVFLEKPRKFVKKTKVLPKNHKKLDDSSLPVFDEFWILDYLYKVSDQSNDFIVNISDDGGIERFGMDYFYSYSTYGISITKFDKTIRFNYPAEMRFQAYKIFLEYTLCVSDFRVNGALVRDRIGLYEFFDKSYKIDMNIVKEDDFFNICSICIRLEELRNIL